MSLLDDIVANKKEEIARQKDRLSPDRLMTQRLTKCRDFKSAVQGKNISIIAEVKRNSPSTGLIRRDFDPVKIAKLYQQHGARAISVLTDQRFFGGKDKTLPVIRSEVKLPVLRKDFIIDEFQIYQSRALGADAILLIVRILSFEELKHFLALARKLGMACLVEVRTIAELDRALLTGAEIIGINNRDLDTLKVDINRSLQLRRRIPDGYITISESGIKTRDDIAKLEDTGFDGVLIGETLLKAGDIASELNQLSGRGDGKTR